MKASRPANEAARLRALREYGVLDTAPEAVFDDIVRLAARACGTPAAMITFLDASRQWFKSVYGPTFGETDRDLSFCAHTILSPDVLVVPDTTQDSRFADNPLVLGPPYVHFYAGVPLTSPEGLAVGTLAVIDFAPRHLHPEQLDSLQILRRQVTAQLDLRRAPMQKPPDMATAEASLQSSADRHRALFDASLDAIVTMDALGRITEFNPAAERLFGYHRTEAVGQIMAELIIPPMDRDRHACGLARYLRTGEAAILGRRVEVSALRRDGTLFPVELSIHRVGRGEPPVFTGFIRDISDRLQVTRELQASEDRSRRQRTAMTRLIQDERLYHGDLATALRQITETVAATLNVARVSVWRYGGDRSVLRALDLYELPTNRHSEGTELSAAAVPAYFQAMEQQEVVAASDARHDPRTCEFAEAYLIPLGITSMMDARIHLDGALHGVLCLEHIGTPRDWTPEDQTFTVAVANLVSLALEGHQRKQAQEALVAQAEILTAVTESLAAYVERGDSKEAFSRLLRCALAVTGSEHGFVGVVVDGPVLRVLAHEGNIWDQMLKRDFCEPALGHDEEDGYLTFHSFDNLFGDAITTAQVVIANDPDQDSQARGRPGQPPMHSFLGVPIRGREAVTGLVALANRPDGYGIEESRQIEALVQQAGGLCDSYRQRAAALGLEKKRQEAEAAMRSSDERLRIVARATNDVVWDWNLDTDNVFMPEGFGKLFGDEGDQPEVSRESWRHRIHPDDQARIASGLRSAMDSGAQVWSEEYRIRRADGTYAAVFDRGYVLRNERGQPVRMIGAMMDISERKQLEAQFRQSQKLEAVGRLAGGVAHDFNNLLTVIQGHASLLLTEGQQTEDASDSLRQIADAAERAASLTRQLLAFSRKQVLQPTDVNLNETVGNMMRLLLRILGEDISLQMQLSDGPAFVRADASMMEQVILNLAVNARDAMPNGGRLTISTHVERIAGDGVEADARAGLFVRLTMTDSGCGIPAEILPHIFEPFFSTKGVERGTGLGLATVYGVITQHHGWVTARSVPEAGTTFDIYLPAIEVPTHPLPVSAAELSESGGNEAILIVEDEAPVRQLARRLLERQGYTVFEAESGPAALAVWHEHQGQIDLVLTDMVMPEGLSGLELADRLLALQPRLKVIVTSGYSVELGGKELTRTDRVGFLAKPYSKRQLVGAVRASLDVR
jgi:PAS domain S-box-containing protein